MTAALIGAVEGLKVLLCEKTGMVGGATAASAGTAWVPGTSQSIKAGVPDSIADGERFLNSVVGGRDGEELRAAFLSSGPKAIDELEALTEVRFMAAQKHPDYLDNHPGAAEGGRALVPEPFDGRLLGVADFNRVRPPRSEFLVLGGMMVSRADMVPLRHPFTSLGNFTHAARLIARHAADRLRYKRGTRLVMGNALVARLLYSLRQRKVAIEFEVALADFVVENGAVVGAVVELASGAACHSDEPRCCASHRWPRP